MPVHDADNPGARVRQAISVRDHSAVLIDFDETLFLRSSTESYLGSARPRWLALIVLELLDVLRPWAFLPGERSRFVYRDWLRVLLISVLLPWTLIRWRRQAPALGRRWQNDELLAALQGRGPVHVVTFGFAPVVRPLLAGMTVDAELTVVSSLTRGHRVRAEGKLPAARRELGNQVVVGSLVVTDSEDDADLLAYARTGVLAQWPAAVHETAFFRSYVPFLYTRKGKRAGQRYLVHNVLLEDVVVLVLAFAWTAANPVLTAIGLLTLHLSFWLVYEIGYHENDHRAALRERAPHRPAGAEEHADRMKPVFAWLCALLLALPGCYLVALGAGPSLRTTAGPGSGPAVVGVVLFTWVAYLLVSRAAFAAYNQLETSRRSFPYAVLQLTRTAGYGVLLTASHVGVIALGALVLARWFPYMTYRDLGQHPRGSHRLTMLLAFVVLGLVQAAGDPEVLWSLQAVVVLLYFMGRAHRPLRALLAAQP